MKFINHPRYGKVYPVLSIDRRFNYPNVARLGLTFFSIMNSMILYSTFVMPIFTAQAAAVFANPLFLIPSLAYNVRLYSKHYSLFYGDRSLITAIFLKPEGKSIIAEYRSGDSKEIFNTDIYWKKDIENRFEVRTEFYHGANIYSQIKGKARICDPWCLKEILDNKTIDTKNKEYDFDISKEFTWEFRDLVEIKKRRRYITKIYPANLKNLMAVKSAQSFEK